MVSERGGQDVWEDGAFENYVGGEEEGDEVGEVDGGVYREGGEGVAG